MAYADELANLERPRDIHERPAEQIAKQVLCRKPRRDSGDSPDREQRLESNPNDFAQAQGCDGY